VLLGVVAEVGPRGVRVVADTRRPTGGVAVGGYAPVGVVSAPLPTVGGAEAESARGVPAAAPEVLAGMGINVAMLRSVQADLAAGTMVELDVDLDPMYLQLRYARNERANLSQIESLVDMVRLSEGRTA
jgi:hypothetical protein